MSRSGYGEEGTVPMELWTQIVARSLKGKRGQSFLKELASAMDAMPDKKLIRHALIDDGGQCCTIGVVCKSRGINVGNIDEYDPRSVGDAVGISMAMAAEIEFLNDEMHTSELPAERWIRMRQWVEEQLYSAPQAHGEQAAERQGE